MSERDAREVQRRLSLNPYYNGKYSMRSYIPLQKQITKSLNPYYNGKYSMSMKQKCLLFRTQSVLILIIMENTL